MARSKLDLRDIAWELESISLETRILKTILKAEQMSDNELAVMLTSSDKETRDYARTAKKWKDHRSNKSI